MSSEPSEDAGFKAMFRQWTAVTLFKRLVLIIERRNVASDLVDRRRS